jgi:hypothetical protein
MKTRLTLLAAAISAMIANDMIRPTGEIRVKEIEQEAADIAATCPDDAAPAVPATVDQLAAINDKLDGVQDALGLLVHAIPA